jgi:hypothetical protein
MVRRLRLGRGANGTMITLRRGTTAMRSLLVAAGIVLAVSTSATAETISFSDSIPLSLTSWSSSVSVSKFDPSLGTLNSITFELSGHVEGGAKFESLDSSPTTVTMNLTADIELQRPDTSTIVITTPLVQTVDSVTAYDDVLDFGGTSGKTYTNLSADDSDSAVSPPPASDLTLFTGLGNITLPVTATGASSGTGAGNLVLQFNAMASATVKVTYDYEPVPEPFALRLLSVGTVALCAYGWRRWRRG